MSDIEEQRAKIAETVAKLPRGIGHGVGNADICCTIAAINLALTGKVTDDPISCISEVVRIWVINVQDHMPIKMLNSPEWRALIPLIAGTGQEREAERAAVALDWMWGTVLPQLQGVADKGGYGEAWREMCEQRTVAAACAAADAAYAAYAAYANAYAANAAANAAYAAAADAADADVRADVRADFWRAVDPASALRRMIDAAPLSQGEGE